MALNIGPNVIKHFMAVIYKCWKQAREPLSQASSLRTIVYYARQKFYNTDCRCQCYKTFFFARVRLSLA